MSDRLSPRKGVNGGKALTPVSRRRFQTGSIKIKGRTHGGPVFVGRYFEYVKTTLGEKRKEKRLVLGQTSEMTLSEARRRLQPLVDRVNKQALTGYMCGDISFEELCQKWEEKELPQYELSSRKGSISTLAPVRLYFGNMRLSQIRGEDVQGYIAYQQTNEYSPKTIRNQCGIMRTVWNVGRKWEYCERDIFFKVKYPKIARGTQRYFTENEVQSLITFSPTLEEALFWELFAKAGCRFGELSVVSPIDSFRFYKKIHPRTGEELELCHMAILRTRWHGHIRELAGKSDNAIRVVRLGPALTKRVRALITRWKPNPKKVLFASRTGNPWAYSWVRRRLLDTCQMLRIDNANTKAFRHHSATMLASMGVPGPVRTSRLGHFSTEFQEAVYAKPVLEDEELYAIALDERIAPQRDSICGATMDAELDNELITQVVTGTTQ